MLLIKVLLLAIASGAAMDIKNFREAWSHFIKILDQTVKLKESINAFGQLNENKQGILGLVKEQLKDRLKPVVLSTELAFSPPHDAYIAIVEDKRGIGVIEDPFCFLWRKSWVELKKHFAGTVPSCAVFFLGMAEMKKKHGRTHYILDPNTGMFGTIKKLFGGAKQHQIRMLAEYILEKGEFKFTVHSDLIQELVVVTLGNGIALHHEINSFHLVTTHPFRITGKRKLTDLAFMYNITVYRFARIGSESARDPPISAPPAFLLSSLKIGNTLGLTMVLLAALAYAMRRFARPHDSSSSSFDEESKQ